MTNTNNQDNTYWYCTPVAATFVLTHEEFRVLAHRHDDLNPRCPSLVEESRVDDYDDGLDDEIDPGCVMRFVKSIRAGEVTCPEDGILTSGFVEMDAYPIYTLPKNQKLRFTPYYYGGKKNNQYVPAQDEGYVRNPDVHTIEYDPDKNPILFVAPSNKPINSPDIFEGEKPYTYPELVQEFVEKFGNYLPDGFDWDSHIGIIEVN